jgi:hypothetical protein
LLDASFGVYDDMKSHTEAIMTLGEGAADQVVSTKQKQIQGVQQKLNLILLMILHQRFYGHNCF